MNYHYQLHMQRFKFTITRMITQPIATRCLGGFIQLRHLHLFCYFVVACTLDMLRQQTATTGMILNFPSITVQGVEAVEIY